MINSSVFSSQTNEWATPQGLFDKLNQEFHFTLDVCANASNAKCDKYYTIEDDGLKQIWTGVVWMNPPYGREIANWVKKAYESDCTCVCLIPVRSDTRWWHSYIMKASEIRLLNKRLSFGDSKNKAPFPSTIVVFGKNSFLKVTTLEI